MDSRITHVLKELSSKGRLSLEEKYLQHGRTTILEHSVNVAEEALEIADKIHLNVNEPDLIRGALLHDYYLYDWHDKKNAPAMHGFKHPYIALSKAEEDFELSDIEKNIIKCHMFPLTLIPPKYTEAWVVCIADKMCVAKETAAPRLKKILHAHG